MISSFLNRIVDNQKSTSISSKLRDKRLSQFLKVFDINNESTILDVGGTSTIWLGTGLEENVTLLNLTRPKPEDINRGFKCVQGNALRMDFFENNSFDVVFSNSVIEHVGSRENQYRFAEEVQRVGKGYWIQTPNKFFPIEPHFLFPYFQFFPVRIQKKIAVKWGLSHYKRWEKSDEKILNELSNIRLLTSKEMLELFTNTNLYKEKFLGFTKSLVAYKKS